MVVVMGGTVPAAPVVVVVVVAAAVVVPGAPDPEPGEVPAAPCPGEDAPDDHPA